MAKMKLADPKAELVSEDGITSFPKSVAVEFSPT